MTILFITLIFIHVNNYVFIEGFSSYPAQLTRSTRWTSLHLIKSSTKTDIETIVETKADQDPVQLPSPVRYINKLSVSIVKDFIIYFYSDRYYARFYALETIARVPYFSYGNFD